jgi:hypothetical protein
MNNPLIKSKDSRTNWKYVLIVVTLAIVAGISIVDYYQRETKRSSSDSFHQIRTQKETKEKINKLNIPGRWFFPGGEAPSGYLIFHKNGILEIPEWIGGEARKTSLRWRYEQDKNLLIIDFKRAPELLPEDERILQDYFGNVEESSWIGSFSGYNTKEKEIAIRVTEQTIALEFFGWLFYKKFPP